MKVAVAGTFVFVKGHFIMDGWAFEPAPGEELTQHTVNACVLDYLRALIVEAPQLAAQVQAQQLVERMRKGAPDA